MVDAEKTMFDIIQISAIEFKSKNINTNLAVYTFVCT